MKERHSFIFRLLKWAVILRSFMNKYLDKQMNWGVQIENKICNAKTIRSTKS